MEPFRNVFSYFMPYWKNSKRKMLLLIFLTTLMAIVTTTGPFLLTEIINGIKEFVGLGERARVAKAEKIMPWVYLFIVCSVCGALMRYWMLPVLRAGQNFVFSKAIRAKLLDAVLQKQPEFYSKYKQGDLIARLTDDIDDGLKIEWYSCSGVLRPVEAVVIFLGIASFMLYMNPSLALYCLLPVPVQIFILTKTQRIQRHLFSERQQRTSSTIEALTAAFAGIRIVLTYVAEQAQNILVDRTLKEREKSEIHVVTMQALLERGGELLNQAGLIILVFLGGSMVIDGRLSLGEFTAFWAYMSFLAPVVWTLSWFIVSTNLVNASVKRHQEILEEDIREAGEKEVPVDEVALEELDFGWTSNSLILQQIEMSLQRAQMVAVVGAVGSGKSTLLQLSSGLLPSSAGRVLLGGVDIYSVKNSIRAKELSFVPQKNSLFSGTVEENVRMDREHISCEDVRESLELACVHEEFSFDRLIEEGGEGLSGGQRARVALARAIANKPRFLILDDVTASLDAKTEDNFWTNLRNRQPEMGILVATHREATVRIADLVYWLDDGRIRASGTHQELLKELDYRLLFAKEEVGAA